MVAMLIIALTTVFSLRAVQVSGEAAVRAQEVRRATSLIESLMSGVPEGLAPGGLDGGFAWTRKVEALGAERPIALCRRLVELRNADSGRRYWASAVETCPIADPA